MGCLAKATLAVVLVVTPEGTGGGEFAQLVPDHCFGHVNRNVLTTVVHSESQPDEIGGDDAAALPGFDYILGARFDGGIDLFH